MSTHPYPSQLKHVLNISKSLFYIGRRRQVHDAKTSLVERQKVLSLRIAPKQSEGAEIPVNVLSLREIPERFLAFVAPSGVVASIRRCQIQCRRDFQPGRNSMFYYVEFRSFMKEVVVLIYFSPARKLLEI